MKKAVFEAQDVDAMMQSKGKNKCLLQLRSPDLPFLRSKNIDRREDTPGVDFCFGMLNHDGRMTSLHRSVWCQRWNHSFSFAFSFFCLAMTWMFVCSTIRDNVFNLSFHFARENQARCVRWSIRWWLKNLRRLRLCTLSCGVQHVLSGQRRHIRSCLCSIIISPPS